MTWPKLLSTLLCGAAASLSGCQTQEPRTPADDNTLDADEAASGALDESAGTDDNANGVATSQGEGDTDLGVEEKLALDTVRHHLAQVSSDETDPLRFAVVQQGPNQPWVLGVINQGETPATLVADPRLLAFDVRVPGKKQALICQLPGNLRPTRAERQYRVWLAPGEGVVKAFDPRLYCFASSGQHVLVPGAIVTPRFGWPEKTKTVWRGGKKEIVKLEQEEPFVARIRDSMEEATDISEADEQVPSADVEASSESADTAPASGSIKQLRAQPIALDSAYREWSSVGIVHQPKRRSPIVIDMQQGSDAHSHMNATVAITLKNRDKRTHYVYFRRELLNFEVTGPGGFVSCDPQPEIRAPDQQAFLRLGAGQSMTITSRLVELCRKGTFGRPGFYLVHARFETKEDGAEFGIDAYVGQVASEKPANVRIRTGELEPQDRQALRPLQIVE